MPFSYTINQTQWEKFLRGKMPPFSLLFTIVLTLIHLLWQQFLMLQVGGLILRALHWKANFFIVNKQTFTICNYCSRWCIYNHSSGFGGELEYVWTECASCQARLYCKTTAYVKDFIWKNLHLKTEFDYSSHAHMMKEDQRSHNLVLRKKSANLAFIY